jgi:cell division protein FtsW
MRIPRGDDSVLGRWWLSIDRGLLAVLLLLVAAGIVISLASSPPLAVRKGLPALYFAERQIVFATAGVVVMLAVSLLSPHAVRLMALMLFLAGVAAMIVVLLYGEEINGARRWLRIAGFSLQPSELAKPGFAVLAAWAFCEHARRPDMPGLPIAVVLLGALATLLVLQPDIGQTLLIGTVWIALFMMASRSRIAVAALGGLVAAGAAAAYAAFPHVRLRVDRFLFPPRGENTQLDRAYQSFADGGLLGRGPGEGTIKLLLPDAHTDFVFAVVAEEFGALACLALLVLIATAVLRPMQRAAGTHDLFTRYATTGLALLVGLQALINLGTNVGLLPSKGMTLPFVSVGGSSTIAVAISFGMLLALTRRRSDPRDVRLPGLETASVRSA